MRILQLKKLTAKRLMHNLSLVGEFSDNIGSVMLVYPPVRNVETHLISIPICWN